MQLFNGDSHLVHWLHYWHLRTWIHDNLCYLTIKSDSGQHSQFLRYFLHNALKRQTLKSGLCLLLKQLPFVKTTSSVAVSPLRFSFGVLLGFTQSPKPTLIQFSFCSKSLFKILPGCCAASSSSGKTALTCLRTDFYKKLLLICFQIYFFHYVPKVETEGSGARDFWLWTSYTANRWPLVNRKFQIGILKLPTEFLCQKQAGHSWFCLISLAGVTLCFLACHNRSMDRRLTIQGFSDLYH